MNLILQEHTIVITQCHCPSVDAIFAHFHIGKKTKYTYYQKGCVHINHCVIKTNTPIQVNDHIQIQCIEEEDAITPWFEDLQVCYEDDVVLIVNKPSNLLVHSDGIETKHTLSNFVKGYYVQQHIQTPVRPIHRLDKDTSGLVIFSKVPFFQPMFDCMLAQKQIQREYYAFVKGRMKTTHTTITEAIGKHRHHSQKMRVSRNGKNAKTDVFVQQVFPTYTFLRCQLHTGRTHQIRVHLAHVHHPILSDFVYGTLDARIDRLALHAYGVSFYHPILQKYIWVQCPLPDDMKRLLQK